MLKPTVLILSLFTFFTSSQAAVADIQNCLNNKSPCICSVQDAGNCPSGLDWYSDSYPFNFQYSFECDGQAYCAFGEELCAQCQRIESGTNPQRVVEVVFDNTMECDRARTDYDNGKLMADRSGRVIVGTHSPTRILPCNNVPRLLPVKSGAALMSHSAVVVTAISSAAAAVLSIM
mmetsp:Transcript_389/g.545  ORF Transcript_389/g.545 Transcript_389/m.545 type:complete len:176 (-) Transcript_389:263-790(-)